jgi:hypothetical protein
MDDNHLVVLGEMKATVKALTEDVTDIKNDQKDQNKKLDKLLEFHNQSKGARALLKAFAASGFLGWLWEHLHK